MINENAFAHERAVFGHYPEVRRAVAEVESQIEVGISANFPVFGVVDGLGYPSGLNFDGRERHNLKTPLVDKAVQRRIGLEAHAGEITVDTVGVVEEKNRLYRIARIPDLPVAVDVGELDRVILWPSIELAS